MEAYFDELLKLNPFMAAFLGDRSRDSEWVNSLSPEYQKAMDALVRKHMHAKMLGEERAIFDVLARDYWEGRKYKLEWMPITSFNNPIVDFAFLNKTIYPKNHKALLARHRGFMEEIKSMKRNMRTGMKHGMVIPERIRLKVVESLEQFAAHEAFASVAYKECVMDFVAFVRDEYRGRATDGMWALPSGKQMYAYLVRSQTTVDITPEEVHALGVKEVARIWREMKQLGLDMKAMAGDKKYYYNDVGALLKGYEKIRDEVQDTIVKKNFWHAVKPFEVQAVPRSMEATSAGAFYMPPGGRRPGVFYVNTRDFKENPKYNMRALCLHEGVPGHHYQFQYMKERGLARWRQHAIDSTAFVEGWALYAEGLGTYGREDMVGRLTYEMFRACRLVVDTGLHYYGWDFERAVKYMTRYLPAMSRSEIVTEVERYICIPGQAVCYKIGELTLLELKRGWKGDVRDFHERVLGGGVLPLSVVKDNVSSVLKTTKL